jgi:hypothetical protein
MKKTILFFIFVIFLSSSVSAAFPSEGLLHYYDFTDTLKAVDQVTTGTQRNSTTYNTKNSTHQMINGNAVCFDGNAGQTIAFASGMDMNNLAGLTINFWAYRDVDGATRYMFTNNGGGILVGYHSTPKAQYLITTDDKVEGGWDDTPVPNKNDIYMVTISYNDSDGVCAYINGASLGACDTDAGGLTVSSSPVAIGSKYDGSASLWSGCIDEVSISSRKWTQTEIEAAYDGGSGSFYSSSDSTPPTNSTWDITSGNIFSEDSTTWNTNGVLNISSDLLSLTVIASENSNATCVLDSDLNYTLAESTNVNYKFATTDTTSHAYTVYDSISFGLHDLYCSFIDSVGNIGGSGALKLARYGNTTNTLEYPSNAKQLESGYVVFNSSVTTPYGALTNMTFFINASGVFLGNKTIITPTSTVIYNFSTVYLLNGSYVWNVYSCNEKSLCSFAENNFSLLITSDPINPYIAPAITAGSSIDENTEFFTEGGKLVSSFPWQMFLLVFLFIFMFKQGKKKKGGN